MSSRNHSTKPNKDPPNPNHQHPTRPNRSGQGTTHNSSNKSKETSSGIPHSHASTSRHHQGSISHNSPNTNTKLKGHTAVLVPHQGNNLSAALPAAPELIVGATEHSNNDPIIKSKEEERTDENNKIQQSPHSSLTSSKLIEPTHINSLPENVLENLFTFLELSDVRSASLVCSEWNRVISDENGDVWRSHCIRRMSRDVLHSELLATCTTYRSKLRAYFHAWNPQDCSRNIYVKPNGFTIHRNPVAQSTDGARGKIGFNKGRHAWEVVWEGPLGTVAVVGVATQQADVRAQGYIPLLGKDDQSWGWNLVENVLLHNGDSHGNYPLINNAPRYQVGERIRIILDCEDNTLSFEKNYEFLGVAFRGLPQRELLFPAVSAVYGNTEISMVYLGPPLDG